MPCCRDAWVSFLGAAWSLSTEWQFYVLLAALAAARGPRARAGLPWLFLALAVAGLAWSHLAPPDWRFSRAFLGNEAQYFALGTAGADWLDRPETGRRHLACTGLRSDAMHGGGRGRTSWPPRWSGWSVCSPNAVIARRRGCWRRSPRYCGCP